MPNPITASGPAQLAGLARQALSSARQATLLVAELGDVDCDVALYEVDGRPHFACPAGSPVVAALGCLAELHVPLGCARGGGMLELHGRLVPAAGTDAATVELSVESVTVQPGRHARRQAVPVDTYLGAGCDALTTFAARLVAHTNDAHGGRLRAFAARRAGLEPAEIAAAELADLDATGAELRWIDADGVHLLRLPFPYPATDCGQLAAHLRDELHAPSSRTHDRGDS